MQHTDSPAPMQVASERGKFAFGQDSEMINFGPQAQLTSILDNWAPYYTQRIKADGKVNVFKCPVTDQDGKTIECRGGDHLADGHILSMNFYVKGIDDKIPGK
jgi:basic membrane protein A